MVARLRPQALVRHGVDRVGHGKLIVGVRHFRFGRLARRSVPALDVRVFWQVIAVVVLVDSLLGCAEELVR